ncbi:Class E vacuolar protein-sorting machinery protein HSE1 [Zancudomyces culisetae]|uniref:Class E vacuolar protein-sorting machinery protein HSE1 n=1 Tax=Zancudomyces culisetae TaxID=1213189 RepID=A0A1R1PNX4_ZANCU|nr:Class E vacuolar protein-sorting machinery protein HSE1 [Zancudomyces culisetae]|eukprot:OMH82603.1 Class E vacuolar protein-sorting machinery protein HSE1 [Zancudomyces culisetae]
MSWNKGLLGDITLRVDKGGGVVQKFGENISIIQEENIKGNHISKHTIAPTVYSTYSDESEKKESDGLENYLLSMLESNLKKLYSIGGITFENYELILSLLPSVSDNGGRLDTLAPVFPSATLTDKDEQNFAKNYSYPKLKPSIVEKNKPITYENIFLKKSESVSTKSSDSLVNSTKDMETLHDANFKHFSELGRAGLPKYDSMYTDNRCASDNRNKSDFKRDSISNANRYHIELEKVATSTQNKETNTISKKNGVNVFISDNTEKLILNKMSLLGNAEMGTMMNGSRAKEISSSSVAHTSKNHTTNKQIDKNEPKENISVSTKVERSEDSSARTSDISNASSSSRKFSTNSTVFEKCISGYHESSSNHHAFNNQNDSTGHVRYSRLPINTARQQLDKSLPNQPSSNLESRETEVELASQHPNMQKLGYSAFPQPLEFSGTGWGRVNEVPLVTSPNKARYSYTSKNITGPADEDADSLPNMQTHVSQPISIENFKARFKNVTIFDNDRFELGTSPIKAGEGFLASSPSHNQIAAGNEGYSRYGKNGEYIRGKPLPQHPKMKKALGASLPVLRDPMDYVDGSDSLLNINETYDLGRPQQDRAVEHESASNNNTGSNPQARATKYMPSQNTSPSFYNYAYESQCSFTSKQSCDDEVCSTDTNAGCEEIDFLEPPFLVKTLYDYRPVIDGDISFEKGSVLVVLKKVNYDWWYGSVVDPKSYKPLENSSGVFPRVYVESI